MIVISGALVLVALVLLIIGLVATSLPFVYASIAVSVVSFVFLLIGILQRRGEQLPETAGVEPARLQATEVEGVTAIIPAGSRAASEPAAAPVAVSAAADAASADDAPVSGSVLVVPGRPRYHVSGCRYLTGKDPEELEVADARDQGYAACGVCKPDRTLAEEAAAEAHPQPDEPVPPVEEPAAAAAPRKARTASATAAATAAAKPAKAAKAAPAKTAAKAAPAKAAAAAPAAAKAAAKAPAKTAAKKAPAKAAAAKAPGVVVIPDRDKYHRADCRYVRDVDGAKELAKATASRQGYAACGVCKP